MNDLTVDEVLTFVYEFADEISEIEEYYVCNGLVCRN